MQELRKSPNQDLRSDPAWSINSRKMESNPGDFPGFRCLRAAANSSGLKGSAILWPWGVRIFHRLDSCFLTSLVGSRLPVLCAPFFTNCEAKEFTETGHRREERPDLHPCVNYTNNTVGIPTQGRCKGAQFPWRKITMGSAETSQPCLKYFVQYSIFASERPQVRTWGRQTCFLPRAPYILVTPVYPLHMLQQALFVCGLLRCGWHISSQAGHCNFLCMSCIHSRHNLPADCYFFVCYCFVFFKQNDHQVMQKITITFRLRWSSDIMLNCYFAIGYNMTLTPFTYFVVLLKTPRTTWSSHLLKTARNFAASILTVLEYLTSRCTVWVPIIVSKLCFSFLPVRWVSTVVFAN